MFIEDSDSVKIQVRYVVNGKKVEIVEASPETNPDLCAKVQSLEVVFRQPDFATSQRMIASSTVIDASGSPAVNPMTLQTNMLYFLAQSWDAKDKNDKPIPLNNENIGKLRIEIARALINKLFQEVGQIV
jgi:hypothetical protein